MTEAAALVGAVSEPAGSVLPAWQIRGRRLVTIYLPLACFVLILLFPFY